MEIRLVIRKQAKKIPRVSVVAEAGRLVKGQKGQREIRGTVKFHRKSKSGGRELPRVQKLPATLAAERIEAERRTEGGRKECCEGGAGYLTMRGRPLHRYFITAALFDANRQQTCPITIGSGCRALPLISSKHPLIFQQTFCLKEHLRYD